MASPVLLSVKIDETLRRKIDEVVIEQRRADPNGRAVSRAHVVRLALMASSLLNDRCSDQAVPLALSNKGPTL